MVANYNLRVLYIYIIIQHEGIILKKATNITLMPREYHQGNPFGLLHIHQLILIHYSLRLRRNPSPII